MAERSIEQMTLREMFIEAERMTRELIEHLEKGYLPKVSTLAQLVQPTTGGVYASNVEDVTVRNHVSRVLESESFTNQLYERLNRVSEAIASATTRIVAQD